MKERVSATLVTANTAASQRTLMTMRRMRSQPTVRVASARGLEVHRAMKVSIEDLVDKGKSLRSALVGDFCLSVCLVFIQAPIGCFEGIGLVGGQELVGDQRWLEIKIKRWLEREGKRWYARSSRNIGKIRCLQHPTQQLETGYHLLYSWRSTLILGI